MKNEIQKLSPNIRVMIAIVASPTLMVIGYMGYIIVTAQWQELSVTGAIFTALGLFAYFIVFTGHLPGAGRRTNNQHKE